MRFMIFVFVLSNLSVAQSEPSDRPEDGLCLSGRCAGRAVVETPSEALKILEGLKRGGLPGRDSMMFGGSTRDLVLPVPPAKDTVAGPILPPPPPTSVAGPVLPPPPPFTPPVAATSDAEIEVIQRETEKQLARARTPNERVARCTKFVYQVQRGKKKLKKTLVDRCQKTLSYAVTHGLDVANGQASDAHEKNMNQVVGK